jgi:hypothetical protein
MNERRPYVDCCAVPSLETLRRFISNETCLVAIRRCRGCGTHWFYHLCENLSELDCIDDLDEQDAYDRCIWYVRLSDDEATRLMQAECVPEPTLFADRQGFLMDANGMIPINGIPDFLCNTQS